MSFGLRSVLVGRRKGRKVRVRRRGRDAARCCLNGSLSSVVKLQPGPQKTSMGYVNPCSASPFIGSHPRGDPSNKYWEQAVDGNPSS